MKPWRHSLTADISFAVLLILVFIVTLFVATNPERLAFNLAALFVAFSAVLFTRFTSLTAGLIFNIVVVFLYMTYLISDTLLNNAVHGFESWVWALFMPSLSAACGVLSLSTWQMDREYAGLRHQVEHYVTIDRETGLKTLRAFEEELSVFQSVARRNKQQVLLIVWSFRFDGQLKNILSGNERKSLIKEVTDQTKDAFRTEDVMYVMQKEPFLWGTVMLVSPGSAEIMVARMREKTEAIDLRDELGKRAPRVELRIGAKHDEENRLDATQLLEGAISMLQFDV